MAAKKRNPEKLELVEHEGGLYFKARHLLDLLWLRESAAGRQLAADDAIKGSAVGLVFDQWRVRHDLPAVLFFGKADKVQFKGGQVPAIGKLFLSIEDTPDGFPRELLPREGADKAVGVWCYYQILDLEDASLWFGTGGNGIPAQDDTKPILDWDIAKPLRNLTTKIGSGVPGYHIGVPSSIVGGVPVAPPYEPGRTGRVEGTVSHSFLRKDRRYALTAGHVVESGKGLVFGWRHPKRRVAARPVAIFRRDPDKQAVDDYFKRLGVTGRSVPPLGGGPRDAKLFEVDCALAEISEPLVVTEGAYSSLPVSSGKYLRDIKNVGPTGQLRSRRFWPVGEDVLAVGPQTGRQLGRVLGFAVFSGFFKNYQDYAVISLPGYQVSASGNSGQPFVTVRGNHLLGMLLNSIHPGKFFRCGARAMDIRRALDLLEEQMDRASAGQKDTTT